MLKSLGHMTAFASRTLPVDKGRWRISSAAWRLLSGRTAGDGPRTVRTRHGFAMTLDLDEFVDRTIYCSGEWEPVETRIVRRLLKPGDRFVDVGANIGYFTLLASRRVGDSGHVHAVEANARTFGLLQGNVRLNGCGNVTLIHAAVGAEAGEAVLRRREMGNAGGDTVDYDSGDGEPVRVIPLDELLTEAGPIRLIKLDIEGAEAKALQGATSLLSRPDAPALILEFTPRLLRAMGDDPQALLSMLREFGYRIEVSKGDTLGPAEDASILGTDQNYLFCAKAG